MMDLRNIRSFKLCIKYYIQISFIFDKISYIFILYGLFFISITPLVY